MENYLKETMLINYSSEAIQELIETKGWKSLSSTEKIKNIYTFVKDEIKFGYNADDNLKACEVLKEGYGQCNTKATLLMALLRAVGIPCRLHGFSIDPSIKKGILTPFLYRLAPKKIIHTWVEAYDGVKWYNLEGIIIDQAFLKQLQEQFKAESSNFRGYGIATKCLQNPQVEFNNNDTYIQAEGIIDDYGIYESMDAFLKDYSQDLGGVKKLLYQHVIRHQMNNRIKKIRG